MCYLIRFGNLFFIFILDLFIYNKIHRLKKFFSSLIKTGFVVYKTFGYQFGNMIKVLSHTCYIHSLTSMLQCAIKPIPF